MSLIPNPEVDVPVFAAQGRRGGCPPPLEWVSLSFALVLRGKVSVPTLFVLRGKVSVPALLSFWGVSVPVLPVLDAATPTEAHPRESSGIGTHPVLKPTMSSPEQTGMDGLRIDQ